MFSVESKIYQETKNNKNLSKQTKSQEKKPGNWKEDLYQNKGFITQESQYRGPERWHCSIRGLEFDFSIPIRWLVNSFNFKESYKAPFWPQRARHTCTQL